MNEREVNELKDVGPSSSYFFVEQVTGRRAERTQLIAGRRTDQGYRRCELETAAKVKKAASVASDSVG